MQPPFRFGHPFKSDICAHVMPIFSIARSSQASASLVQLTTPTYSKPLYLFINYKTRTKSGHRTADKGPHHEAQKSIISPFIFTLQNQRLL